MPQSAEHLAALDALGVRHGLLAVTRSRPGRPGRRRWPTPARELAAHLAGRGAGGGGQRAHRRRPATSCAPRLDRPGRAGCPRPTPTRRCGCGSTGRSPSAAPAPWSPARSAPAGCAPATSWSCRRPATGAGARPAVASARRSTEVDRGGPGGGEPARRRREDRSAAATRCSPRARSGAPTCVDVRLAGDPAGRACPAEPDRCTSARRPSPPGSGRSARTPPGCGWPRPLPLRVGDRALLRDPGRHHVAGGVDGARRGTARAARRGAAAARAARAGRPGRRAGPGRRAAPPAAGPGRDDLARMGVPATPDAGRRGLAGRPRRTGRGCGARLADEVARYAARAPAGAGRAGRGAAAAPRPARPRAGGGAGRARRCALRGGRVVAPARRAPARAGGRARWTGVRAELADRPFAAPGGDRLAELGPGPRELGGGRPRRCCCIRLADERRAAAPARRATRSRCWPRLPQPFTAQRGPAGPGHQPPGRGAAAGTAGPARRHPAPARRRPRRSTGAGRPVRRTRWA